MTSWPKMKSTKFGMFHCSMTNDTVETWNCAHWFLHYRHDMQQLIKMSGKTILRGRTSLLATILHTHNNNKKRNNIYVLAPHFKPLFSILIIYLHMC